MNAVEYRTVDKSAWSRGPWDSEPDKMQFPDADTGLPCLIVRGPSGALCGYVGVAEGHPAFGRGYDSTDVEVHGGLTYADYCSPHGGEEVGICHVPGDGEPDHVWWLGFDCAHCWDYTPAYSGRPEPCFRQGPNETYRTIDFVKGQVQSLARQLKAMQSEVAE